MRPLYFFFILLLFTESAHAEKILIFGAGYVGTVSGACLASLGHQVTFIELDPDKVRLLNEKKCPFLEPGLDKLLESGKILAKCALGDEILDADMAMVAVATPGSLRGVKALNGALSVLHQSTKKPLIVAIRSTILPKDFRILESLYGDKLLLVANPEFLRESTAVHDFFNPPFCVAGGANSLAVQAVLALYKDISPKCISMAPESACLLKYACNAFHAMKIAFANEIASVCDSMGADPVELMQVFSEDTILNCSSAYLKPGFSFGGSCLAKDLKAFVSNTPVDLPLISSIIPSNESRFEKTLAKILKNNHRSLAILGLSFKKGSDDLRESPFIVLLGRLQRAGITCRVFDPDVAPERLTGANREIFMRHGIPLQKDLSSTLEGCDGIVLCKDLLTEAPEGVPIYDLGYFLSN